MGGGGAALSYPYYDPETNRTRTRRTSTTKNSWEDAHKWLVQKQIDLRGVGDAAPENPTVGEYLYGWLADVVEPSVAPKTHEKRSYHVRVHLAPAIGHLRLKDLQARQIHTLYVRRSRREDQGLRSLAYSTRRDAWQDVGVSVKPLGYGGVSEEALDELRVRVSGQ